MRMDYSNEFRIRDTCLELLIEVQTYRIYISRKKKKKKKKEFSSLVMIKNSVLFHRPFIS